MKFLSTNTSKSYSNEHIVELAREYMSNDTENLTDTQILNSLDIDTKSKLIELENKDKRGDQQRVMVWFALAGMLLYPVFILVADWLDLSQAANLMANIAPTYFVSAMVIVVIFFGSEKLADKLTDKIGKS